MRKVVRLILSFLVITYTVDLHAQILSGPQIDSLVEKVRETFRVPGIAVGIVKDGKVIHSRGYGVRSLETQAPVNEHTLFAIASNSKAFTATALGMLIDEGKLDWDTKVTEVIPEFKMYDPYVTAEFTVRDLLCHRSGLGLGAGDLMFWPDSADFTKAEVIHNLRYLKPVSSFRSKYDYDNLLYVVAGEVIARLSGMSWEDYIEKRIMQPLGMQESAASVPRIKDPSNVIDAHAPLNGEIVPIPSHLGQTTNAAGGINSNLVDLSKWVIMHLHGGRYGKDLQQRLISRQNHQELWSPQTIMGGGSNYNTNFSMYGLGFRLNDEAGHMVVSHTGGLAGVVTKITMIPDLDLGIIVLTNQQSGAAFSAITDQIKDGYYGITGQDRVAQYAKNEAEYRAHAEKVTQEVWADIENVMKSGAAPDNLATYTGTYEDAWFGKVFIEETEQGLYFTAARSPQLRGPMYYYKGNTFIVKWNNRTMDADAYVMFTLDEQGRGLSIAMKPISPMTDFSYDFQDLDLKKLSKE